MERLPRKATFFTPLGNSGLAIFMFSSSISLDSENDTRFFAPSPTGDWWEQGNERTNNRNTGSKLILLGVEIVTKAAILTWS